MAAIGAAVGGAPHEQMATLGGGQQHLLRAQERVRVARRAGRLSTMAHRVLLFHEVDRRRHLGPGQRLFNRRGPGTRKNKGAAYGGCP